MGKPSTDNLVAFHKSCADEFREILKKFNILFYGFGSKANLLVEIFGEAKIFNMHFHTATSLIDELVISGNFSSQCRTVGSLDKELLERGEEMILILLNFRFDLPGLADAKAIHLIATIEDTNYSFLMDDILRYNFVFRDLTTFENYTEETADMELRSKKVEDTIQIINNVSQNARRVFYELMKLGNCSSVDLFNKVKVPLMLSRRTSLMNLLVQFVDHEIIKIRDRCQIQIHLNSKERKAVLDFMATQK